MSAKINDGLTTKQRYILRHKERLLIVWREEKRRAYPKHREKNLARSKAWREANKDKERERGKKRWAKKILERKADPETTKAHDKALYRKHREYHRQYNKAHAQERLAATRDWYQRMPEASRAKQAAKRNRRRALLLEAPGHFTAEDVQEKLRIQRHKCYWCKRPHGKVYHVDHVIPLVRGGSNGNDNIVISCKTCNLSKRDKLPSEFMSVLL